MHESLNLSQSYVSFIELNGKLIFWQHQQIQLSYCPCQIQNRICQWKHLPKSTRVPLGVQDQKIQKYTESVQIGLPEKKRDIKDLFIYLLTIWGCYKIDQK